MTPSDLQALADMVIALKPSDLPPAPWVLQRSLPGFIQQGWFPGGPYMTVTDNESWLRELQRDVNAGPRGARGQTGAVQADLEALAVILNKTKTEAA